MSDLIVQNEVAGGAVYGVKQYSYTVAGDSGKDFIAALTAATFKEATAIEATASAYGETIRQRQTKVSDLGQALAEVNYAMATMDPKSNDPDKTGSNSDLPAAAALLAKYGISLGNSGSSITYRNATTAQNNIQYALDIENNNLQQDLVSLQSMISKRDNAYSTAAKLVKKADNAASRTIGNMGE